MKHPKTNVTKKILAIILAFCLIAPAIFSLLPQEVQADETDEFGFRLSIPSDFNGKDGKNPYGNGYSSLNPVMEPYAFTRDGSANSMNWYQTNEDKGKETYLFDYATNKSSAPGKANSLPSTGDLSFVQATAYDPGDGHDSMVAMVGRTSGNKLVVRTVDTTNGNSKSATLISDMGGVDKYHSSV